MIKNKTVSNALWMIGCRIVQAFLNLLITMFTARFLGPSNFGLIQYAMSIAAFAAPLMQLGFTGIMIRELINHPREEGEILGTAMLACCGSAILSMAGVLLFVLLANWGEKTTMIVCGLYSLTLLAQAFEIILYWFQAHLLSRYSSVVSLLAYILVAIYKMILLAEKMSVYWFALANALDAALIAASLFVIYRKLGGRKLAFSKQIFRRMIHNGKYYILSGLMIAIFAQTDRIMLKMYINEAATGYYSAATTCAGLIGFVFTAILDSAGPTILEARKKSVQQFETSVITLYSVIIFAALTQSALITLLAKPIIYILYGREYTPAIAALRIVVWYSTFCYLGSAKNIWILAENKQHLIWKIDLPGAAANVLLNVVLIPRYGINGAAAASLLTQIFTNIFMLLVFRQTRRTVVLMGKSLDPRNLIAISRRLSVRQGL